MWEIKIAGLIKFVKYCFIVSQKIGKNNLFSNQKIFLSSLILNLD